MFNRRELLAGSVALALAACTETPTIPAAVSNALPADVQSAVGDIGSIISKVESLGSSIPATVSNAIDKAKGLVSSITPANATDAIKQIVPVIGAIATLLPPPYGTIALAIETLLPGIASVAGAVFSRRAATGMSAAQARALLAAR